MKYLLIIVLLNFSSFQLLSAYLSVSRQRKLKGSFLMFSSELEPIPFHIFSSFFILNFSFFILRLVSIVNISYPNWLDLNKYQHYCNFFQPKFCPLSYWWQPSYYRNDAHFNHGWTIFLTNINFIFLIFQFSLSYL